MTQPPLVIPSDVEVAQAGKSLLANGSALYTLASDDFEVLRVTFVFRAGSAMQRVPFSASAAANMLAEGTRDMTAHQIAERLINLHIPRALIALFQKRVRLPVPALLCKLPRLIDRIFRHAGLFVSRISAPKRIFIDPQKLPVRSSVNKCSQSSISNRESLLPDRSRRCKF